MKTICSAQDQGTLPLEVIIRTLKEGASWTLFGRRLAAGAWEFYAASDGSALEGTVSEDDETELPYRTSAPWLSDWSAAITLYSQHPWFTLYPIEVHPEFRERVMVALCAATLNSGSAGASPGECLMREWLRACEERVQEKILQVCLEHRYWTLFGIRDGVGGWRYYTEWSPHPEEAAARLVPHQQCLPPSVRTWEDAVCQFDQRDWSSVKPLYVHPEFRPRVSHLLCRRMLAAAPGIDALPVRHSGEWLKLLIPTVEEKSTSEPQSYPELRERKVKWCEWKEKPKCDFGHGVHYHDGKISGHDESVVAAFVEDFSGDGEEDEAVIYCISPNKITTERVLTAMKRQIERALKKGEMPHGQITKRIWGLWNA